MNIEDIREYCLTKPHTDEALSLLSYDFNSSVIVGFGGNLWHYLGMAYFTIGSHYHYGTCQ